jgi:DNA-binding NtrC family response regulator
MQSRKILVIDDEVMVADVCRRSLSLTGHQVNCAYSGEHAVELVMETRYDLAVIDAMLPGMNGIETFEAMRQICPYLKGILVSGDLTVGMALEAVEKGFSRVLSKPVEADELLKVVQRALVEADLPEKSGREDAKYL